MKNKLYLIIIAILVIAFSSCSDNLSRSKAEKLIKAKYQLPKDEITDFIIWDETFSCLSSTKWQLLDLQNKGLLTYSEIINSYGVAGGCKGDLTAKGKEYAVSDIYNDVDNNGVHFADKKINVKVAKLEFGEITGIQEMKQFNTAEVSYTLVRKDITPFGEVFKCVEGKENKTATFKKYDDGWRIER